MFKTISTLALATSLSFSANAQWFTGFKYANISDDVASSDISIDAIYALFGYEFKVGEKFSLAPEIRYGTGNGADRLQGIRVSVDRLMALGLRGEYQVDDNVYLYGLTSYTNLELEVKTRGVSATADEWELGLGAGIGYRFNDNVSVEVSYETFDGTDVVTAGFKVPF